MSDITVNNNNSDDNNANALLNYVDPYCYMVNYIGLDFLNSIPDIYDVIILLISIPDYFNNYRSFKDISKDENSEYRFIGGMRPEHQFYAFFVNKNLVLKAVVKLKMACNFTFKILV